jgi:exopolyphosphatase/pppGpp-phosphohydrolase
LTFSALEFDGIKEDLICSTRAERARIQAIPDYRVGTLPLALIAIERVLALGIEELRWSRYALKEGAAARVLFGR